MWDDDDPNHMSPTFKHMLGGMMSTSREMAWMYAPFVNSYKRYQLGSWAPTAILWSHDNRTCGFRVVGEHQGNRVESRLPGGDVNPYLGYAATIAAGLHGIQNQIECPPLFEGNAYESKDAERVPSSLHEAIAEMERSEVMREAFGDFVFGHLREHGPPGADHLRQPDRHRLGADPVLRTRLMLAGARPRVRVGHEESQP